MNTTIGTLTLFLGFCVVLIVSQRNRQIATALLAGFAIRAALTLIDALVVHLPGANDGIYWDSDAAYMARNGVAGTLQYIDTGHFFYKWLMSVLYAVFARSPLMITGINVFVGTLIIKSTWQLSLLLGKDEKRAKVAAWVMALCPSAIYFSAVLLREVAVTYPLLLSIVYLIRWYDERKTVLLVGAFLTLIISMVFHSGAFAVLLFGGLWFVGNWFRAILTGRFEHFGRNTAALFIGVGVVVAVMASGFGLDKFNGLQAGNIETLTIRQEDFAHGRAVYLEDLHANSPVDVVWQAPIRIAYFLFAPFPWMISSGSDAFGLLDSILFVILFVYALRHRREAAQSPAILLVFGVFAAMALVFAIGVSNYGTALRHRNKMLPLLLAAAVSIPVARRKRTLAGPPGSLLNGPRVPRAWTHAPVVTRQSSR